MSQKRTDMAKNERKTVHKKITETTMSEKNKPRKNLGVISDAPKGHFFWIVLAFDNLL